MMIEYSERKWDSGVGRQCEELKPLFGGISVVLYLWEGLPNQTSGKFPCGDLVDRAFSVDPFFPSLPPEASTSLYPPSQTSSVLYDRMRAQLGCPEPFYCWVGDSTSSQTWGSKGRGRWWVVLSSRTAYPFHFLCLSFILPPDVEKQKSDFTLWELILSLEPLEAS